MKLNRRKLLQSAAVMAADVVKAAPSGTPDWSKVREDFPWLKEKLWLTAADYHPIGVHSLRAMQNYLVCRAQGPGEGRTQFSGTEQRETKEMFARLIGATPAEIAFVQNTTEDRKSVV